MEVRIILNSQIKSSSKICNLTVSISLVMCQFSRMLRLKATRQEEAI